jgi:hypothetical protein
MIHHQKTESIRLYSKRKIIFSAKPQTPSPEQEWWGAQNNYKYK